MAASPTHLDDSSFPCVLSGAKKGEAWAAEALFTDLQPRLLRFLRATEPRAADDLAGEVWLAMAKGIARVRRRPRRLPGMGVLHRPASPGRSASHRGAACHRRRRPGRRRDVAGRPTVADADVAGLVAGQMAAQDAVDLIHADLPPDQAEVVLLRVSASSTSPTSPR